MPNTKTEYHIVDTLTLKGLREAERLHMSGWTICYTGLSLIYFSRTVETKPAKHEAA